MDVPGFDELLEGGKFRLSDFPAPQSRRRQWDAWTRELSKGNFEAAMRSMLAQYAHDLDLPISGGRILPLWAGERVETLAYFFISGYGDSFLFGRYFRALCERAEHVNAIVQYPLRDLFEINVPPQVDVFDFYNASDGLRCADAYAYECFLPHQTGQGYGEAAWIHSERAERAQGCAPARVGIAWFGSTGNRYNDLRSVPLARLGPLFEVPGIEWHSLQGGQRVIPPEGVIDHAHELGNFLDTANLIATLDLVVSVDTAVANLAGAMGLPLWALLEPLDDSDFRWGIAEERTPWYPSARMFRQGKDRKWKPVIRRVAEALGEWRAERTELPPSAGTSSAYARAESGIVAPQRGEQQS